MVRTLIAGNWKMNGMQASLAEVDSVVNGLEGLADDADILICPPATLLGAMTARAGDRLKTGGQTCHTAESGAHTGDVSAAMLAEAGASYVIVGHSERRADHGETNETVADQARAAQLAGLIPIICLGESLDQRKAGDTLKVITQQLANSVPETAPDAPGFVVAYEPIWAIGTGEVATPEQIEEVHTHLRTELVGRFGEAGADVPLLYGGSMKPGNAGDILAIMDVNGGLIGGASLKADDFMAIYRTAIGLV